MITKKRIALLAASLLLVVSLQAQEQPSASASPSVTAPSEHAAASAIQVTKIVTSESGLLSAAEIAKLVEPYEHRSLALADLQALVESFNRLYLKKGYPTARAVLQAQSVHDGVVQIQLIEARVARVIVNNATHTRSSFFSHRIPLNSGEVLNLKDVQERLAYFNATNDLQVHAVLQPGESFGTTDVVLDASGPKDFEASVFTDNAGRDSIGLYRAGGSATYRSLLGKRDPLTLAFVGADGTLAGNGAYSIPLDWHGTRLSALIDYNTIAINGGVLGSTDMTGHSMDETLMLSRPFSIRTTRSLSASLAAHYKHSDLLAAGLQLTRTNVRSLELTVDWQHYDRRGSWAMKNQFNGGFYSVGDSAAFFRYNGMLTRSTILIPRIISIARVSGQLHAVNPLPSVEQYQIGGASTVRGYPEASLTGDRGFIAGNEFDINFLRHKWAQRVQGDVFVEGGAVYGNGVSSANAASDTHLLSTGFGFICHAGNHITGRVDIGVPLRNAVGLDAVNVHFSVQSTLGFPKHWWPHHRG